MTSFTKHDSLLCLQRFEFNISEAEKTYVGGCKWFYPRSQWWDRDVIERIWQKSEAALKHEHNTRPLLLLIVYQITVTAQSNEKGVNNV